MWKYIAIALALLALATDGRAQDVNSDGKITFLVPVNAQSVTPGARGTLWQTEVWLHNGLSDPFSIGGCGGILPCLAEFYQPGETRLVEDQWSTGPYVFSIDATIATSITLSARLFELTRHTQPAGVHLPVVRERDFFSQPVRFLALDGTARSRVALRVYDPFRSNGAVRVDIFDKTGALIATTGLTLDPVSISAADPGFAAIYDLAAAFPQLSGVDRFDVLVTPLVTGMKYWALVSVTDQDTQQVLLVTPD